jgi:hypothetical protein
LIKTEPTALRAKLFRALRARKTLIKTEPTALRAKLFRALHARKTLIKTEPTALRAKLSRALRARKTLIKTEPTALRAKLSRALHARKTLPETINARARRARRSHRHCHARGAQRRSFDEMVLLGFGTDGDKYEYLCSIAIYGQRCAAQMTSSCPVSLRVHSITSLIKSCWCLLK